MQHYGCVRGEVTHGSRLWVICVCNKDTRRLVEGKKYIKMTLKGWRSRVPLSQSGAEVPELIPATHTSVLIPLLNCQSCLTSMWSIQADTRVIMIDWIFSEHESTATCGRETATCVAARQDCSHYGAILCVSASAAAAVRPDLPHPDSTSGSQVMHKLVESTKALPYFSPHSRCVHVVQVMKSFCAHVVFIKFPQTAQKSKRGYSDYNKKSEFFSWSCHFLCFSVMSNTYQAVCACAC